MLTENFILIRDFINQEGQEAVNSSLFKIAISFGANEEIAQEAVQEIFASGIGKKSAEHPKAYLRRALENKIIEISSREKKRGTLFIPTEESPDITTKPAPFYSETKIRDLYKIAIVNVLKRHNKLTAQKEMIATLLLEGFGKPREMMYIMSSTSVETIRTQKSRISKFWREHRREILIEIANIKNAEILQKYREPI